MADKGSTVRITIAGDNKAAPSFNEAAQGAGALEVAVEGLDGQTSSRPPLHMFALVPGSGYPVASGQA